MSILLALLAGSVVGYAGSLAVLIWIDYLRNSNADRFLRASFVSLTVISFVLLGFLRHPLIALGTAGVLFATVSLALILVHAGRNEAK